MSLRSLNSEPDSPTRTRGRVLVGGDVKSAKYLQIRSLSRSLFLGKLKKSSFRLPAGFSQVRDMNRARLRQFKAVLAIVLGVFIIVPGPSFARAERLPVKTYTAADGLASNRISRIVRDSRGYLWFCTENGLSRFDGSRFTNYTAEEGLRDGEVNDLLETRGGAYWIATGNGLCLYNPKGLPLPNEQASLRSNPMFVVYHPGSNRMASDIKSLYEDRSGAVWVGAWRGLYRLEQAGGKVKFHFIELGMPADE